MEKNLAIESFQKCIHCLNLNDLYKDILNQSNIIFIDKDGKTLLTFNIANNFSKPNFINNSKEYLEIIKITKLKDLSTLFGDKSLACSIIKRNTGNIEGYLIIDNLKIIKTEILLFLDILSKQIYNTYQLLLIESKIDHNLINYKTKKLKMKELEILKLISQGKKDKEISGILHISLSSVRKYIESIFIKLNINNRVHLCSFYYNYTFNEIIKN